MSKKKIEPKKKERRLEHDEPGNQPGGPKRKKMQREKIKYNNPKQWLDSADDDESV